VRLFEGKQLPDWQPLDSFGERVSLRDLARNRILWVSFLKRGDRDEGFEKGLSRLETYLPDEVVIVSLVDVGLLGGEAATDAVSARALRTGRDLGRVLVLPRKAFPRGNPAGDLPLHLLVDRTGKVRKVLEGVLELRQVGSRLKALLEEY